MVEEFKKLDEIMVGTINRSLEILDALRVEMKEPTERLMFKVIVNEMGIIPLDKEVERIVTATIVGVPPKGEILEFNEKSWYVNSIEFEEKISTPDGKILEQKKETLLE